MHFDRASVARRRLAPIERPAIVISMLYQPFRGLVLREGLLQHMDKEPRLLCWSYSREEKSRLDALLKEIGAPPAHDIEKTQGCLTLRSIIDGVGEAGKAADPDGSLAPLDSDEKVLLFYNIPQKGVFILLNLFKKEAGLPRPIYAMVTEHSIDWPFHQLLEHLVEERTRMESAAGAPGEGQGS